MNNKQITFSKLKEMLIKGIDNIIAQSDYINDLNVFPVPDGDTGLNLKQTLSKAMEAVSHQNFNGINDFSKTFARETLMNARGNSGIIISRVIRGLTMPLDHCVDDVNLDDFFNAFQKSYEISYTAVQNPTEGTMLSVTRFIAEALETQKPNIESIEQLLTIVYAAAANAVIQSPNLLPVLKENNAIDSGAFALLQFYRGFLEANDLPITEYNLFQELSVQSAKDQQKELLKQKQSNFEEKSGFGYCCEFVLRLGLKIAPNQKTKRDYQYDEIINDLDAYNAESVVIVQEDDILKIHAHLLAPDKLLKIGQRYGEFISVKIENMNLQFQEHIADRFQKYESDDLILDKKSAIFTFLPTTELKQFVHDRYGLDYLWDLEAQGSPNNKHLVEEFYETKAQRIYVFAINAKQKRKLTNAEQFINRKQNLQIIQVSSYMNALFLLSFYEKRRPNWWNKKLLQRIAQYFNHLFITEKVNSNDNTKSFVLKNGRKTVLESSNLIEVSEKMLEIFLRIRSSFKTFDVVLLYNDQTANQTIPHITQLLKQDQRVIEVHDFFVESEKNLLTIGLIKNGEEN
ncbi:DAK2 domain fusion protein YloV [Mycoplasmoides fastidiosum]|uniref:DAK2 domain fusion protein YloV n=1 Tax=Mycoplasmoides fastidiosum TaxID=92758 RepID=A0ABU0LZB9_9BACT|nr:DAK2 domain-containing protein [Mycoplasmoides fastidiosum]MDQ0514055.1 DAK2 domain fusion protein YloV [Mycoplasmoides fastidiosum]UUD37534.1 DAK2 domain-containing protein [Mycoplasmoides fastidiosum]